MTKLENLQIQLKEAEKQVIKYIELDMHDHSMTYLIEAMKLKNEVKTAMDEEKLNKFISKALNFSSKSDVVRNYVNKEFHVDAIIYDISLDKLIEILYKEEK